MEILTEIVYLAGYSGGLHLKIRAQVSVQKAFFCFNFIRRSYVDTEFKTKSNLI